MILSLRLPKISNTPCIYSVNNIYIKEGGFISRGTKLLDLKQDLHLNLVHDCPSINFYRLVTQEQLWLRRLLISPGQVIDDSHLMGIFSTDRDEFIGNTPVFERDIRLGYTGIIHEVDWYGLD